MVTTIAIDDQQAWGPLAMALMASMTQAFGISLQRRSHLDQPANDPKPLYKRPLWLFGFLIYTLSNIVGSTCTIGYLPIVILAPVGAIGLVFNAIFAKLVLGDPFTTRTILGTFFYLHACTVSLSTGRIFTIQNITIGTMLIVLGAMLVAGFGVVPEPNHTLQDLIRLYKRPAFIVYFAIVEICTGLGLLTTHVLEYGLNHPSTATVNRYIRIRPEWKMWLGIRYGNKDRTERSGQSR